MLVRHARKFLVCYNFAFGHGQMIHPNLQEVIKV